MAHGVDSSVCGKVLKFADDTYKTI